MALFMQAIEVKPGMRVRPKGVKAGRHWLSVRRVQRQGFLVRIEGEWVAGGKFAFCVPSTQEFSGGYPRCSES